jgi:hypothetical protein
MINNTYYLFEGFGRKLAIGGAILGGSTAGHLLGVNTGEHLASKAMNNENFSDNYIARKFKREFDKLSPEIKVSIDDSKMIVNHYKTKDPELMKAVKDHQGNKLKEAGRLGGDVVGSVGGGIVGYKLGKKILKKK